MDLNSMVAHQSSTHWMDLIFDQVGQGVPLGHVDIQPQNLQTAASFHQGNWMRAQMGPTPHGSTTLGVAHGPPFRSLYQISRQVGHMVPQPLSTKSVPDGLKVQNSIFCLGSPSDSLSLCKRHYLGITLTKRIQSSCLIKKTDHSLFKTWHVYFNSVLQTSEIVIYCATIQFFYH